MKLGLDKKELQKICKVFDQFKKIDSVIIFGSRSMGNFKKGSDIDLALMGDIDSSTLNQIKLLLNEETPLPYFFDIVVYNEIESKDLKDHIDHYGKIIYKKN